MQKFALVHIQIFNLMLGSWSVNMKLDLIFQLGSKHSWIWKKYAKSTTTPLVYNFEESGQTCTQRRSKRKRSFKSVKSWTQGSLIKDFLVNNGFGISLGCKFGICWPSLNPKCPTWVKCSLAHPHTIVQEQVYKKVVGCAHTQINCHSKCNQIFWVPLG